MIVFQSLYIKVLIKLNRGKKHWRALCLLCSYPLLGVQAGPGLEGTSAGPGNELDWLPATTALLLDKRILLLLPSRFDPLALAMAHMAKQMQVAGILRQELHN